MLSVETLQRKKKTYKNKLVERKAFFGTVGMKLVWFQFS